MAQTIERTLVRATIFWDMRDPANVHWRSRTDWSDGAVEKTEWEPGIDGRENIVQAVQLLVHKETGFKLKITRSDVSEVQETGGLFHATWKEPQP